jgi:hypothetical protein
MCGKITMQSVGHWAAVCALALVLAGSLPGPQVPAASAVAASVPAGTARIWVYRDYEPYGSRNYATVTLNGALAGQVSPNGGAFYRDVAPGRYHIGVVSAGMDVNQAKDIDLTPGQEAFVKVLAATDWESGGDTSQYRRDTFYVSVVPPQVARAELPAHPLTGG